MTCVRRMGERGNKKDIWWWNEEVKEAASRKKERSTQGNVYEQY